MDQAGQTCDDDFGRTEFVKPLTKLRKLRFIPEAVFPGRIRQKACFRDIGRNDVCQRNQAAQLLTVFVDMSRGSLAMTMQKLIGRGFLKQEELKPAKEAKTGLEGWLVRDESSEERKKQTEFVLPVLKIRTKHRQT